MTSFFIVDIVQQVPLTNCDTDAVLFLKQLLIILSMILTLVSIGSQKEQRTFIEKLRFGQIILCLVALEPKQARRDAQWVG